MLGSDGSKSRIQFCQANDILLVHFYSKWHSFWFCFIDINFYLISCAFFPGTSRGKILGHPGSVAREEGLTLVINISLQCLSCGSQCDLTRCATFFSYSFISPLPLAWIKIVLCFLCVTLWKWMFILAKWFWGERSLHYKIL